MNLLADEGVDLRLAGLSPMTRAGIVTSVVQGRESELAGAFTVISPGVVRIRKK